jgi:hypothetical protein
VPSGSARIEASRPPRRRCSASGDCGLKLGGCQKQIRQCKAIGNQRTCQSDRCRNDAKPRHERRQTLIRSSGEDGRARKMRRNDASTWSRRSLPTAQRGISIGHVFRIPTDGVSLFKKKGKRNVRPDVPNCFRAVLLPPCRPPLCALPDPCLSLWIVGQRAVLEAEAKVVPFVAAIRGGVPVAVEGVYLASQSCVSVSR